MPLIHRSSKNAKILDVAGLNEITVLIDRSETELTEVAFNAWALGLDGPPHAHEGKEQNFLVTAGRGLVKIDGVSYPAAKGAFFYLPAGVVHQTITQGEERMVYFLFNAFLDASKEGHASFADHIGTVRETRRKQADTQQSGVTLSGSRPALPGKYIDTNKIGGLDTMILSREEAQRCEAILYRLPAGHNLNAASDPSKEQTFFIISGAGRFTVGGETVEVESGQTVFVPKNTALEIDAAGEGMVTISFGTVV